VSEFQSAKIGVELNGEGYGYCLEQRGLCDPIDRSGHLCSRGLRAGHLSILGMAQPRFASQSRGTGAVQAAVDAPRSSRRHRPAGRDM